MRYAEQIKGLRQRLKLSQQQFADKLQVSQGTVSRWEAGTQEPSKDIFQKMEQLGNFERSDLLKDLGIPFPPDEWGREINIKGQVCINKLVDSIEWTRDQWITMTISEVPAWEYLQISAYLISDGSNRTYTENSIVFVVPFDIDKIEPKPGDRLIFAEKHERSGRYEILLMEYSESFEDNHVMLRCGGMSMDFRSSLWEIVSAGGGGFREAGFIGLVVGGTIIEDVNRIAPQKRPSISMRSDE